MPAALTPAEQIERLAAPPRKLKACSACHVVKTAKAFYSSPSRVLSSKCRECAKAYRNNRYHDQATTEKSP